MLSTDDLVARKVSRLVSLVGRFEVSLESHFLCHKTDPATVQFAKIAADFWVGEEMKG